MSPSAVEAERVVVGKKEVREKEVRWPAVEDGAKGKGRRRRTEGEVEEGEDGGVAEEEEENPIQRNLQVYVGLSEEVSRGMTGLASPVPVAQ